MTRFVWAAAVGLLAGPGGAAAQDPAKPLTKIAFGSCADQNKPCPVWGRVADQQPDLLVLLGDNVYADLEDGKLKPATPDKIARCYADLARVPDWQRLKAACPILAVWDDHDYGHNDAGAEWEHKDEAQRLLLDFFGVPADSPRRARKGVYHAATFGPPGKRVQVILLDTRYHRSPLSKGPRTQVPGYAGTIAPYVPVTAPGATFLGDDQWAWLADQLRQPAELRLLCSGIQVVSDEHPFEKWANIPAERARLVRLVRDTGANGVVVLSGDRHLGELSVDPAGAGYPLYDLTSSGLNQGAKGWRPPEPNRHRVAGMPYGDNFGLVTVDWAAADPVVTLQLRDDAGEVVLKQAFPVSLLRSKGDPPADPPAEAKLPPGVVGPEEALKKAGEEVTVQFPVRAGRAVSGGKVVLLNSEADFRSPKNFTVAVYEEGMTGRLSKATYDTFKGKTVRVKGKVVEYQKRLQIQVRDAKQVEFVDDKK